MFGRTFIFICTPLFLGGRRQKAEDRRQKAEGRRQQFIFFPITHHQSPITNYLFRGC
ncbi:hypothetical protein [Sphaerospermopsis sp. FACHB-1194]|uniref:hypothetical protein n=1 Tax=Sphaerospermopsis sp. FACHB-1194 TaxID=2692862 RepID=UPI001681BEA0|nr:hypothetical protein [Sphaerospermopsis sp. FACHB-1194]MBD2147491.1 hypothetical protein [Sphaerospermopsis sp. FACHB-1194]